MLKERLAIVPSKNEILDFEFGILGSVAEYTFVTKFSIFVAKNLKSDDAYMLI